MHTFQLSCRKNPIHSTYGTEYTAMSSNAQSNCNVVRTSCADPPHFFNTTPSIPVPLVYHAGISCPKYSSNAYSQIRRYTIFHKIPLERAIYEERKKLTSILLYCFSSAKTTSTLFFISFQPKPYTSKRNTYKPNIL